ncbi:hypothetical protein PF005_g30175 [Phytophthora fragariae]|uniref:Uncharacterized protein n=2 Tax=Phytophthora TaxID=4783 RepID=A0A6A3H059_9STRA|nr:hypothetical protein PF003_g6990 [Phytophthora fragariae]KAE9288937.1 hypothetical protein PR003_g25682 [Phytophthora rubi]KAE8922903.1 hypothetical protein PF009_g26838 [Phytophthora fragariae]KAE8962690.1 hypothetical protein PF011_g29290 [Phytophthora fragariae]KAE9062145.1 hypothetical protein PF010_g29522 [Phytophthora fragariae]
MALRLAERAIETKTSMQVQSSSEGPRQCQWEMVGHYIAGDMEMRVAELDDATQDGVVAG